MPNPAIEFTVHSHIVAEFWRKDDDVSLLMQLGVMPVSQPA